MCTGITDISGLAECCSTYNGYSVNKYMPVTGDLYHDPVTQQVLVF